MLAFFVAMLTNIGVLRGFVNFCLLMSLVLALNYLLQVTSKCTSNHHRNLVYGHSSERYLWLQCSRRSFQWTCSAS